MRKKILQIDKNKWKYPQIYKNTFTEFTPRYFTGDFSEVNVY